MTIHCRSCNGTGSVYTGTGHRSDRYPYGEEMKVRACGCGASGKKTSPEVIAARKVEFARRLGAFGDRIAAEMRAKSGVEPQWVKDRRKENAEYNTWHAARTGEMT